MLSLDSVQNTKNLIAPYIQRTPLTRCEPEIRPPQLREVDLHFKLELLQYSGSFKLRGALAVALDSSKTGPGFTAVSAGNHAVSVAYVGKILNRSTKVVMISTANPARVERAESYGASIVFENTGADAFETVDRIQREEHYTLIHPFDGPLTSAGTGTLALEVLEDCPDPDVVIIPVGGGGLASGVAFTIKQKAPHCKVIGVNVQGADAMFKSMQAGERCPNSGSVLIADSLCPPFVGEYAFSICKKFLDEMTLVSPQEIREAMAYLWEHQKLMVEGAAAAALAAAMGPLRDRLVGKKVVVVLSGSNINFEKFKSEASLEN
jgi:threonine dehydratase